MDELSEAEVDDLDRWWRAANYLSVGQNYLLHKLDMMLVTGPGHGAAGLNALAAVERVAGVAGRLAQ